MYYGNLSHACIILNTFGLIHLSFAPIKQLSLYNTYKLKYILNFMLAVLYEQEFCLYILIMWTTAFFFKWETDVLEKCFDTENGLFHFLSFTSCLKPHDDKIRQVIKEWRCNTIILSYYWWSCLFKFYQQSVYVYFYLLSLYTLHAYYGKWWFDLHSNANCRLIYNIYPRQPDVIESLIARFMWPSWGPPGNDRTEVGPM